jgi:L-rhamnose mutarotase
MERVCFLARVRPDRLDEYRAAHRRVWPEMTTALSSAGWANYTIFLADDGLLVGYLETDDYEAALERMARTGVNDRWQGEMAPFFASPAGPGGQRPDEGFRRITEIFHLD